MIAPPPRATKGRSRGVGKSHQRRHVEIDHLFHGIHIGLQQRLQAADARVVNQQGDAGVRGDDRLDPLQVTPVVQVRGNRLDYAARGIGDARRQLVEPGLVACDENEVVAPPSQPVGINRTDSGGGTCDDCDTFVRDGHGTSPFIAPLARRGDEFWVGHRNAARTSSMVCWDSAGEGSARCREVASARRRFYRRVRSPSLP